MNKKLIFLLSLITTITLHAQNLIEAVKNYNKNPALLKDIKKILEENKNNPQFDINQKVEKGATALWYAAMHAGFGRDVTPLVGLLLEYKADPNIFDKDEGITPLRWAATQSDFKLTKLLLEHGADPNLAPYNPKSQKWPIAKYQGTPLWWATWKTIYEPWNGNQSEKIDLIRTLLEHGADPLLASNGESAFDLVKKHPDRTDLKELFLAKSKKTLSGPRSKKIENVGFTFK